MSLCGQIELLAIDRHEFPKILMSLVRSSRREFPTLLRQSFARSIISSYLVSRNGQTAGYAWDQKPTADFQQFGGTETSLLILPDFQRLGIGTALLHLLKAENSDRFCVLNPRNLKSLKFFRNQTVFDSVFDCPRYAIYRPKSSRTLCGRQSTHTFPAVHKKLST